MQSQLGLAGMWLQGDWVTRAVVLILLTMSLGSWFVIIYKSIQFYGYQKKSLEINDFWKESTLKAGLQHFKNVDKEHLFWDMAQQASQAKLHFESHIIATDLNSSIGLSEWVTSNLQHNLDEASAKMQSGLPWLASVGATAPFVGLFGTVWGIYQALMSIGTAGQATLDQVAGPVGESLIMTALGLAVAIPAVLGYNILLRSQKAVLAQLRRFAHDLHALQITGARLRGQDDTRNEAKLIEVEKSHVV